MSDAAGGTYRRRALRRLSGTALFAMLSAAQGGSAQEAAPTPLFAAHDVLELTFEADFSALEDDREEEAPERPATVVLTDDGGREVRLEAQLRTRGNFRRARANCFMPPLRLNLKTGGLDGTVFEGQDKLKIVGNCRPGRGPYARLVLREYLAYRFLGAVTDQAFRVRLARITYEDTAGQRDTGTEYGFLIEDDEALGARLGGTVFELEGDRNLPPEVFDVRAATRLAIFEYMIGNTDWLEVAGHNVEIFERETGALPVPYDFDFSGLVDAPYASPAPETGLRSVRERLYQGWCRPPGVAEAVLQEFRDAREATIALVEGFTELDPGERQNLLDYLRPFYDAIETDASADQIFLRLCKRLPGGAGPDLTGTQGANR